MAKKPNVFLFVADQMRSDSLHHLGNDAAVTPNLDKLLEDGVSFSNAYCQNPVCVPSRCSFLTGLYPHTTGHRTMHYLQREDEVNILKEMKNNGYEVIWIGRNDVVPANHSKDPYCDEFYDGASLENKKDVIQQFSMGHQTREIPQEIIDNGSLYSFYTGKMDDGNVYGKFDWNCVQSAIDYIERKSKDPDSKPFFIYCTLIFPHPPYGCEEPWYSMIDKSKLPLRRPNINTLSKRAKMLYGIEAKQNLQSWTDEQFDEIRATYLGMVARFDHQFGMIVDKLKSSGMYDDTNIMVYSDHGDYTTDYSIVEKVQNCFENPISNVPFIIKPTKDIKVKPRVSKALVELLDIPVTIADMCGFELSYTQFGKSLLESLAGNELHKEMVICEGGRNIGETHCMEGGHGPSSPYYPRLATQSLEDGSHSKSIMARVGNLKYTMRLDDIDELYDLEQDPFELNNIIDNHEYAQSVADIKQKLLEFMIKTSDFVPSKRDLR